MDFLNSIATPVDETIDWITDGRGFLDWLGQAQLVPADVLDALGEHARPGELDKVARQARDLRDWFRGFVLDHIERPLSAKDLRELERLNRILERGESYCKIVPRDNTRSASLRMRIVQRWDSPDALLIPIAETLARFVCTDDILNVKACQRHPCTLLFVDRTRGRARRWCSMAVCGNRAKQATHRNRIKTDQ